MEAFVVPEKRVKKVMGSSTVHKNPVKEVKIVQSDTIVLSDEDNALIASLTNPLAKAIRDYVNKVADVSQLKELILDATPVYNKLMNSVKQILSRETDSFFLHEAIKPKVSGDVEREMEPTVDSWLMEHPGIGCGIKAVYEELSVKNWQPKMYLSRVILWRRNPPTYKGGNKLIFTCALYHAY